jgi:hypothetical protein
MSRALKVEVEHLGHRQSEIGARVRDMRLPAADPDRLVEAQSDFDHAYRSVGASAPGPLRGESEATYRARLATGLKQFSPMWRGANLYALAPDAAAEAGRAIVADTARTIADPARGDLTDPAQLRRVDAVDPTTGQRVIEWRGNPSAWMSMFMPPRQFLREVRDARGNPIPHVLSWVG